MITENTRPSFWRFLYQLLQSLWHSDHRMPLGSLCLTQCIKLNLRALPTTLLSSLFVGGIMAIQIHAQLHPFDAVSLMGGLSTSVTLRNVGPVLIAFLLTGQVGAFVSAELGTLRITEQINALEGLGLSAFRYFIWPRLLASTFASFCLLLIGLTCSLLGGLLVGSVHLQINPWWYLRTLETLVPHNSLPMAIGKSFWFGGLIGFLACFYGYHARGGAEGVGRCVKKAVIVTLVSIVGSDFLLSLAWKYL